MLDTISSKTAVVATMAKNYSHCPLKKRPIQFFETEQENIVRAQREETAVIIDARKKISSPPIKIEIKIEDEPENLSTKPEDLSKRSRSENTTPVNYSIDSKVPPASFAPTSVIHTSYPPKVESPQEASAPEINVIASAPSVPRLTTSSVSSGTGAFHRVISNASSVNALRRFSPEPHQHYAPTTWHRSVAPHYPPAYFPTLGATVGCYPSPYSSTSSVSSTSSNSPTEIYHPYPLYPASPPSPYAPRDNSCSPPTMMLQRQPLAPIALLPDQYRRAPSIIDRASLSPASSSGVSSLRSHSPINEPADLSPPSAVTVLSINSLTEQSRSRANPTSTTTNTAARHQCPDCGKSYSTFSGLSKHRQFHCAASGDGPRKSFSCKYCEKVYVSLGALKMHIRTHTLPCKCTLCGKAFSRPWLLQGHIRTHTGEKPFSCQHCHRAFADRSNLRAHLQTHSEVKKYSCPTCSKTFSRMSLLTKHAEGGGCNGNANNNTTINSSANLYSSVHPQKHTIDMRHHNLY